MNHPRLSKPTAPPWGLVLTLFLFPLPIRAAAAPKDLSQQLHALDDADPVVRDQTRQDLMSLKRSQLDDLRQAAIAAGSLSPEQATSLHEIVMQVILADAGTQGEVSSTRGFLGASPLPCQITGDNGKPRMAILIAQCIPGFDAYRMLRNGDIVVAIDGNEAATNNIQSFMSTIQTHSPGQILRLQILRGNHKMEVSVHLTPRPLSADNFNPPDLFQAQRDRVEQYWRTNFAPIIKSER